MFVNHTVNAAEHVGTHSKCKCGVKQEELVDETPEFWP